MKEGKLEKEGRKDVRNKERCVCQKWSFIRKTKSEHAKSEEPN